VQDEPRSGRPASVRTSINVGCLRPFIRQDRCSTSRMIVDEHNINECKVHQIVTRFEHENSVCKDIVPKI
jgi:hypothetical protein